MDLSLVPYTGAKGAAAAEEEEEAEVEGGGGGGGCGRYRECLRNHAAAMGGQTYDGCGEFMPGGDEGSLEALKCAACGCHRNFHRRDGLSSPAAAGPRSILLYGPAAAWNKQQPAPPQFPAAFLPPALPLPYHPMQPPPLAAAPPPPLPPCPPDAGCRVGSETPPRRDEAPPSDSAAASGGSSRKRFRTKFTAEQKEKMLAFAEKLGWRVPKQDDVALEEFCLQIGVKRHVLKVWMHNNKSHLSSSSSSSSSAAAAAAPSAAADPSAPPIRV